MDDSQSKPTTAIVTRSMTIMPKHPSAAKITRSAAFYAISATAFKALVSIVVLPSVKLRARDLHDLTRPSLKLVKVPAFTGVNLSSCFLQSINQFNLNNQAQKPNAPCIDRD